MYGVTGKVALVTGAGGGIGRQVCRSLLSHGAFVVAADRDIEAASHSVSEAPGGSLALECDVTDEAAMAATVEKARAEHGRLDVLIGLAGGSSPMDASVTEASADEFWRVMNVDLFGTFLLAKHGIPALAASGGGSLVMMSSIVAMTPVPGRDCYTAAKGAVVALTRSLAATYASVGVRVNAVAPGITLTDRVKGRPDSVDPEAPLVRRHLMGLVQPSEVAAAILYLASEESRTVTGQILQVDSGAALGFAPPRVGQP